MRRPALKLAAVAAAGVLIGAGGVTIASGATPNDAACRAGLSSTSSPTHKDLLTYMACRDDQQDAAIAALKPSIPAASPSASPSVKPSATPTPTASPKPTSLPSPSPTSSAAGYWTASLAGVPAGSMGCGENENTTAGAQLRKQWDHWDNCGGSVVTPSAEGIPAAPGGSNVVKWTHAPGSDQVYQKLNRTFTSASWPGGGINGSNQSTDSPTDVSGIYESYLYIPSAKFTLNPGHGWVQLLQFKENYRRSDGSFTQDPMWGVGCHNFNGPVQCGLYPHVKRTFKLADYEDRWVSFQLRLYQGAKDGTGHGGRVEAWVDGKLMDTGWAKPYDAQGAPVGSAGFSSLAKTEGFVYPVGAYTSNQSTNGVPDYNGTNTVLYVGPSSLRPV